jgi:hypothetical protein
MFCFTIVVSSTSNLCFHLLTLLIFYDISYNLIGYLISNELAPDIVILEYIHDLIIFFMDNYLFN